MPGTIYTAAKEIEAAGGKCKPKSFFFAYILGLPCVVDVRDEQSVQRAIDEAVKRFGGIDILSKSFNFFFVIV